MKHVVASLTIGACLLLPPAGVVFAENPHPAGGVGHTGGIGGLPGVTNGQPGSQPLVPGASPGASCGNLSGGTAGGPPGQLAGPLSNGSMSPFALDILGINKNYAGNTGNSTNNALAGGHSNSQYDVACFQHP
jgi:hypothetical protein